MSAIAHTFVEVNTPQTTTSASFTPIPGASITSGNFTVGKAYLLWITAQMRNDSGGGTIVGMRTMHGASVFSDSDQYNSVDADTWATYHFFRKWTAVSAEGITVEFVAPSGTARVDQLSMLAINLADDVVENTDWFWNQVTTDLGLTTSFQAGATTTFTPAVAGHDWLVLAYAQISTTSAATSSITRLARSGEASSSVPECRRERGGNTTIGQVVARVFTLGAASNTFTEQSATDSGTAHTRLSSSVFVLNLNKFRNHAFSYTEADIALGTGSFGTQLSTINLTPAIAGDVWMGCYFGFKCGDSLRRVVFRHQRDNTDQPTGQSGDLYAHDAGTDATGVDSINLSTMASVTAAAHTFDVDAYTDSTTGTPAARNRLLWAVTMELSGAATLEQEGYRWRYDDGSESSAAFAAAQDTAISASQTAVRRLRVIVNASGDAATQQFQLEAKKSTDPDTNYTRVT